MESTHQGAAYLGMSTVLSLRNDSSMRVSCVGPQRLRPLCLGRPGILDARLRRRRQGRLRGDPSRIGDAALEFLQCGVSSIPWCPSMARQCPVLTLRCPSFTPNASRSDSVMSRIVSHVSKPWSTKAWRYWEMPSSPKMVSNWEAIQPSDSLTCLAGTMHVRVLIEDRMPANGAGRQSPIARALFGGNASSSPKCPRAVGGSSQ